jgi:hypothetical protein
VVDGKLRVGTGDPNRFRAYVVLTPAIEKDSDTVWNDEAGERRCGSVYRCLCSPSSRLIISHYQPSAGVSRPCTGTRPHRLSFVRSVSRTGLCRTFAFTVGGSITLLRVSFLGRNNLWLGVGTPEDPRTSPACVVRSKEDALPGHTDRPPNPT